MKIKFKKTGLDPYSTLPAARRNPEVGPPSYTSCETGGQRYAPHGGAALPGGAPSDDGYPFTRRNSKRRSVQ